MTSILVDPNARDAAVLASPRRLALTGPARLSAEQAARLVPILAALGPRAEFTTGAAPGFDTFAADTLRDLYPEALHRVVVPDAPHDEEGVARAVEAGAFIVVMPEARNAAAAYRARNERVVAHADELLGAVVSTGYYRSGEWMTINIATRAGLPVVLASLAGVER